MTDVFTNKNKTAVIIQSGLVYTVECFADSKLVVKAKVNDHQEAVDLAENFTGLTYIVPVAAPLGENHTHKTFLVE